MSVYSHELMEEMIKRLLPTYEKSRLDLLTITADDVSKADEVFLMGTMSGPVGAIALDGRAVGKGHVGPLTRRLSELYQQALVDPAQGFDMGLKPNH